MVKQSFLRWTGSVSMLHGVQAVSSRRLAAATAGSDWPLPARVQSLLGSPFCIPEDTPQSPLGYAQHQSRTYRQVARSVPERRVKSGYSLFQDWDIQSNVIKIINFSFRLHLRCQDSSWQIMGQFCLSRPPVRNISDIIINAKPSLPS